ncbi:hypothetical protein H2203_002193 [Taxawa tesnikishii (nom. ined.)]|nr:hypothetical protein H2203_002193 [Dothideales sp. JES 119]
MSSTSMSSVEGRMPTKLRMLGQKVKPDIKIKLQGARDAWVSTFSTLDKIEGTVSITAYQDLRFDDVEIQFTGQPTVTSECQESHANTIAGNSKTYVEKLTTATTMSGRSEASHQFLRLTQPIAESSYPQPRTFEAGRTYEFPFLFVVPERLLPRICRHKVSHDSIHEAHIRLPPSLGDRQVAGKGSTLLDDFAPQMAHISYAVVVRINKVKEEGEKRELAVKAKNVRIVPAMSEQPPINVDGQQTDYILRAEKAIRKGVFKGKLGTLIMEAVQPKSLRLPSPRTESDAPVTSMATIKLRFDPAETNSQPPRLGSLGSKLKVSTHYASTARSCIPTRQTTMFDLHQGVHAEYVSLPSRCVAGVEWTYHSDSESAILLRRDSACSTRSNCSSPVPEPSESYKRKGFYTAQILAPITLPTNKSFVPTFHTCLISRIYQLNLHLGIHSVGVGPSIELKLPIQICSEGSGESEVQHRSSLGSLSAEEQLAEEQDASEFFEPRRISPMAEDLVGGSNIPGIAHDLPPEYSAFAPRVPVVG